MEGRIMKGTTFGDFYNFEKKQIKSASELIKDTGAPVFTKEQVLATTDPLTRIFRLILYKRKIKYAFFSAKVKEYYRDQLGESEYQAQTQVGNLKKTIYKGTITYLKFKVYLASIGLDLTNISCSFIDQDGDFLNFSGEDFKENEDDS